MNHQYDCLVIGAGLAGSVAARELAERGGKRVLVLERRNHVGGNAYDCFDEAGVLIHQYGPHIFHTNSTRVFDYLSRFTRWRPYEHQVVANLPDGDGRLEYPVPFNLVSLRAAFPPEKARALAEKLVSAYGMEKKVTILELRQNPDPELSALADYVYGHVFVRYTMKQWGQTPEEIDPNTTARVPVFLSEDCRYFQDAYQGMPLEGYTPMFQSLLDHPDITVELGVDAASRLTRSIVARCQEVAAAYALSPRETEVFMLLAQGRTCSFVQEELVLAESTVKTHMSHIYAKLGVSGRQEMMDLLFGETKGGIDA